MRDQVSHEQAVVIGDNGSLSVPVVWWRQTFDDGLCQMS